LARRANRCGDGVPYGKHGPWGMFREGVKELTDKIDKGKISPAAASAQLQAEGVIVSARTLEEKSRMAPGGPSGRPVWRYHQRRIRCAPVERAARRRDDLSPACTPSPPTSPSAPPARPDCADGAPTHPTGRALTARPLPTKEGSSVGLWISSHGNSPGTTRRGYRHRELVAWTSAWVYVHSRQYCWWSSCIWSYTEGLYQ
jgi:hypothetical protein